MEYALIGEHLGHSFSPELHAALGLEGYGLCEIGRDELPAFMRNFPLKGANVTIPYKEAVIPYLDRLDNSAAATGAVNTIVNEGASLTGYNTDVYGFQALARHLGVSFQGLKVLVLGGGGAAKAVVQAVKSGGAAEVVSAVRTPKAAGQLRLSDTEAYSDCRIIVNCTPVGMFPELEGNIVDLACFSRLSAVLDCVYNPLRSNLVLDAQEAFIPAEGGLYMLVAQAVAAQSRFFGSAPEDSASERVYQALLRNKRNIVLCGMPSCGKSSLGKALAKRTGRTFVDTDELVAFKAGMPVPEIFAAFGEERFRRLETEAINEVAVRQGMVISTGGGAVLRPENVRALKRNGVVCLVERSLENLRSTPDRPLSSSPEALAALYEKRMPLYRSVAEVSVLNDGPFAAAVDYLEKYVG